jgi:hypothetical protein
MYVTVRRYKNAAALADAISAKSSEVKDVISAIPGFVNYYGSRDGDVFTSVSIFNDKAGCDESTRRAAEWVRENVKSMPDKPEVSGGEVFLSFSK